MLQSLYQTATPLAVSVFLILSFLHRATGASTENVSDSDGSLLWGPYRPNLYFGIRPRVPNSLLTGLMWSKVNDFATVQNSESFP